MEKWQEEIEEVLQEHALGDEEKVTKANELLHLTREVENPSGDLGQFIDRVLGIASEKNRPLVIAYIGFRIGVAYERYQNANKA